MTQTAGMEALAEKILSGEAPENLRSAAARGALPLPRGLMAQLQVYLLHDSLETVRQAAAESLKSMEPEAIQACLSESDCTAEVLSHFAGQSTRNGTLAESIVFHANTPAEALERLAASGNGAVIELVLTNQQKRRYKSWHVFSAVVSFAALPPKALKRLIIKTWTY